eukprot:12403731-Ditylum_brightwellii.AAC.1
MSGFNIFQVFACEWRCNKEFKFKSVFKWKKAALKRRFVIAPVALNYISDDMVCDVNANIICANDDSGVEMSDDVAFVYGVVEVSIKTLFQLVIKASVSSGHEEVI